MPSLYIFVCLSGIDMKISTVCGLFSGAIALSSIFMIGFAPIAWIFSESSNSLIFMGWLHLSFWTISIYFGLCFLNKSIFHLKNDSQGHLKVWGLIFVLVCLQMTSTLRPILGTSDTFLPKEKKFFLSHWAECMK
jgi:hypothetical protein